MEIEWKMEEFNYQLPIINYQFLHTQALLEHRVAAIRNDRELAAVAAKHYEQALEQYRKEVTEKPYLRKLEFLCMSDAARVEYLATGDYAKAIQKFEIVIQQRKTNERLGALFSAEFRTAEGTTAAAAGLYDDTLFTRTKESFLRERERNKIHPLTAHIAEQHAWSLLDQWKVVEAEKQFTEAVIIRAANNRETGSRWALIYALHDRHGQALTARYRGNTERAIEEYRTALKRIDEELAKCTELQSHTSPGTLPSELGRMSQRLKERAANTRERLADCALYGGAASGIGQSRLTEMTKLYEEASQLYKTPNMVQTMRCKQAIGLLLQGKINEAEKILIEYSQFASQSLRTELVKQLADAMLSFQKNTENPVERKKLLRQFLHQFTIPSNPAGADAQRRETLELRLFCAEFLVSDAWNKAEIPALQRDLPFLRQPIHFFFERLGSRPFIRRYCDLIVRTLALLYDHVADPAMKQGLIVGIVQILESLRLQEISEKKEAAEASPALVVFFLTEEPKDGFVIFYPQDDRPGTLFRLPMTRRQIKEGTKPGNVEVLDPQLLKLIEEERKAKRSIRISWNDTAAWSRAEDALTDTEFPFDLNIERHTN
jgi:tetratricopeptide (TPR) repeat protein